MGGSATIAAADDLVAVIAHISWFAALGAALEPSEAVDLAIYVKGLGLPDAAAERVVDWAQAARIAGDPHWDPSWWNAEERLRGALLAQAESRLGRAAVLERLSAVTMAAHAATIGAAAMAAAREGVADQALARVAAGAATQASYQAALAALAGADAAEHPFAAKLRLFRAGRWPLGIVRGKAYIF
jgi:hypothetical protein